MVIAVSLEKVVTATKTAANLERARYQGEVQVMTTAVKTQAKQGMMGNNTRQAEE